MKDHRVRRTEFIATISFSLIAVVVVAFVEIGAAWPIPFWAYLCYAAVWSLVLLPLVLMDYTTPKALIYLSFVLSLVVLWTVPWTSRKRFLKDLYAIKPGMTVAEVETKMRQYIKGTGWPPYPYDKDSSGAAILRDIGSGAAYRTESSPDGELVLPGCVVYRHSNGGAFNADWGIIRVENRRVASVEFSPD
jgi:hypothetical protein